MFKTSLSLLLVLVLVIAGCSGGKEKTEIIVKFSEAEYLYNLAGDSGDSIFNAAYVFALANYNAEKEEFLSVFVKRLSEIDPEYRLASRYNLIEFRDQINYQSTNQDVVNVLSEAVKLERENLIQILRIRIAYACKSLSYVSDTRGKAEVLVKILPEKNTFSFTANRKFDKTRITNLIQSGSDFGFWETYNLPEIWEYLLNTNNAIKESLNAGNLKTADFLRKDTAKAVIDNPLFSILIPSVSTDGKLKEGDVAGVSKITDTSRVNKIMTIPFVKSMFPRNLKFMWEKSSNAFDNNLLNLIAVKITTRDGRAPMPGEFITEAKANESKGQIRVRIKMSSEGARICSRLTRENVMRYIALVNDNSVYANVFIVSEITGGDFEISGNFTPEEADELAALLNAGPIPEFGVKVISVN